MRARGRVTFPTPSCPVEEEEEEGEEERERERGLKAGLRQDRRGFSSTAKPTRACVPCCAWLVC